MPPSLFLLLLITYPVCQAQEALCTAPERYPNDCLHSAFKMNYRTLDGHCNNVRNPSWGAANNIYTRFLPQRFADELNTPIGVNPDQLINGQRIPRARDISNRRFSQTKKLEYSEETALLPMWGQFLVHDINLQQISLARSSFTTGKPCNESCSYSSPCFPVQVPQDDPTRNVGCVTTWPFTNRNKIRCNSDDGSSDTNLRPHEIINRATSYVDGSMIYGNTDEVASLVRDLQTGLFIEGEKSKFSNKMLLPKNIIGLPVVCRVPGAGDLLGGGLTAAINATSNCFKAADGRVNVHSAMVTLQTLWVREHQRLVQKLRHLNPHWKGATLYYEARKIIGAMLQIISYNQYLPRIIGPVGMKMLGPYQCYNPKVKAASSAGFSGAAFRYGHETVNNVLAHSLGLQYKPKFFLFHETAFNAALIETLGMDGFIRGMTYFPTKKNGAARGTADSMREHLFRAHNTTFGGDLVSIDIQRGRDRGLAPYIDYVEACGLGKIKSWNDLQHLIQDKAALLDLKDLYKDVRNIDLYVGGHAEALVRGGKVGPTFRCLMVDTMRKIRDGDRFWYENKQFTRNQLKELGKVNLQKVFCDNGDDIREMTASVWRVPGPVNPVLPCSAFPDIDLRPWTETMRPRRG